MLLKQLLRRLLHAPGFTVAVVLLVTAVVAVHATAFGAIYALRWKALPYAEGDRLVELRADLQAFGFKLGLRESLVRQVREDSRTFAGAVGFRSTAYPLRDEAGRRWQVERVTPGFARVLGVTPALGRAFGHDDAYVGTEGVLLLSDRVWRGRFGGDPAALGRTVRFADREFTVIGVMPRGFLFPEPQVDAWIPYVASASERVEDAGGNIGHLNVVARLAPGATVAQARDRLEALLAHADDLAARRQTAKLRADVRLWRERFAAGHGRALTLLQLAAVLLLVVAAANLANLGLDRMMARRSEYRIRRALGARGRDLLCLGIADLLPPALAGVVLGLLLAPAGTAVLRARGLLPEDLPIDVGGDAATLLVAVAAAAIPLALALAAVSVTLARDRTHDTDLSEHVRTGDIGRTRAAMLVTQVALTTALVGGAGLLLHSAVNLVNEDPGFDSHGVLLTAVDLVGVTHEDADEDPAARESRLRPLVEPLREAIAALPGVERVAITHMAPFTGWDAVMILGVPGAEDVVQARGRNIGPGYFDAMGIELRAGRDFTAGEVEDSVVVVDELFQKQYLRDADPLSASLTIGEGDQGNPREARIVGVVRTIKHASLEETPELPTVYFFSPTPVPVFFLVTRTAGDAAALVEPVRLSLRREAPFAETILNEPLNQAIARSLTDRRALLEAVGVFAVITLAFAALGLYAVLNVTVRRRTSELGVRMALGATRRRILGLVLRQGGRLIAAGVVLGLGVGVPLARLLADRLYELTPSDPPTWIITSAVVVFTALFACWLPARRATRVDPMIALKAE